MSIVADFSVPSGAFCLGESLQSLPSVSVELDRLVAHSPEYVMPFVWILNADGDDFDEALADDLTVESAEITDRFEDATLYQFTWTGTVSERLGLILDHTGVILEARGSGDEWRLRVRFGSRGHFGEFRRHFQRFGAVTLHSMLPPQTPGGMTFGVSSKQREALLAAMDGGYYDAPRTTATEELAQRFDISQQAFSGRLRRGVRTLVGNTLDRHRND